MQRVQETAMNRNVTENNWRQRWHHAIVEAVEWDIVENNWKLRWHHAIVDAVEVMDWDILEGDWNRTKGKVMQQWTRLTYDQLDSVSGRHDELVDRIQECYGVAKYEAERQIRDWGARNDEWFDKAARRIQQNAAMLRH
jgi:uncharacterized protein YjbJ (UPF0337 family)